jgi:hypothetical protein
MYQRKIFILREIFSFSNKFIHKRITLIYEILVHRNHSKIVMSMQALGKSIPPIRQVVGSCFSYKVMPISQFIPN